MYRKMENKNYDTAEEAIEDLKNGYFIIEIFRGIQLENHEILNVILIIVK
jgi:hypothetical protein